MAGRCFDEWQVGDRVIHEIRRTVTETDNLLFSTMTHNPQPLHLDVEAAKASEFGNILVNGTFTFALMVGLSVGCHEFKPRHARTKKRLPRSEWIEIPCPAIIEETQFQNVQRLLAERDRHLTPPRTTTSDVLLGKVARCGSCGAKLQLATGTSRTGVVYHYYKCSAKLLKGFCAGGDPASIRRETLDDLVVDKVASELLTAERVREIVNRAAGMHSGARESASARVKQLKVQLQAAKRKESNLWDLAADQGVKARQGFLGKLDAVQEEVAGLQQQIAAYETLLGSTVRSISDSEAMAEGAKMRDLLLTADIKRKRRFINSVVESVTVRTDLIEITGPETSLAEAAHDINIVAGQPVRGSDREWCPIYHPSGHSDYWRISVAR